MRSMVEGTARRTDIDDILNRRAFILKHILRRDTQDSYFMTGEPRVALGVALRPIAEAVTLPVDLDRQPYLGTEEVEHIRASRMLPPEFEASRPRPQRAPQQAFGQAQRPSQCARAFDCVPRSGEHSAFPSNTLPVPGRNFSICHGMPDAQPTYA